MKSGMEMKSLGTVLMKKVFEQTEEDLAINNE